MNIDESSILRDPQGCSTDNGKTHIVPAVIQGNISSSTVQDASGCTQFMGPIIAYQFVVTGSSFLFWGWGCGNE
jgi:hypothetical protein